MPQTLARLATRAAQILLAACLAAYLLYFADHARQLLGFGYPLDYGEGPLLAQVEQLRAGTPIWRLYADPAQPPYLIVNYPPLYLLLSAGLSSLTGSALIAGRLISLLATLGSTLAIAVLARSPRSSALSLQPSALLALIFLSIPIVREWSMLMRVDMLGLCLGLWGLVALRKAVAERSGLSAIGYRLSALISGLLLLGCLLTKPSLIAAPAAAIVWLPWSLIKKEGYERRPLMRSFFIVVATLAIGGGLIVGLLQWASGGWFWLHVVAANANRWEYALAHGFWEQQLKLRWPLGAAALLALATALWRRRPVALPLLYTFFSLFNVVGVGKVGAYSNYFLELYAGLVWLIALDRHATGAAQRGDEKDFFSERRPLALSVQQRYGSRFEGLLTILTLLLATASLVYYPPLWDASRLRPAGLIEPSPPRLFFGRYGLQADARREAELLAALERVNAALLDEVRAAGDQIFTDMPGVAAAARVGSRLQAFEARQLLDQSLTGQSELLLDLANGRLPLAVIDYLGNWLTPEVIELLQRRYAQDGSLGTFDIYRPVDLGPHSTIDWAIDESGLRLTGYRLAAPAGAAYEPGELLTLALEWERIGSAPADDLRVVVQLTTPDGTPLLEQERPLLYGVFAPASWPAGVLVQHIQPLPLPAELPEGDYALAVALRDAGGSDLARQMIAGLRVQSAGGQLFAETDHFVPAVLMRGWDELGGLERVGLPITPVVPFAWGRLQCFERLCLALQASNVTPRTLGEQLYKAETIRGAGCRGGNPDTNGLCPGFAAARYPNLGPAISGELERGGYLVQWTSYARLERRLNDDEIGLGRLGDDSLRLPPGQTYRWP